MNKCYKCDKKKKTVKSFGKDICIACLKERKTGRKGHSGMIYNKNSSGNRILIDEGIRLINVPKSNPLFTKWYIEHYPKSKGIVGRQLNYLIYYKDEPCGIISATSPPLNYKRFNKYFDNINEKLFVNNSVFRIVKSPIKNFATQVLRLFRKTIYQDYYKRYGDILQGIITFVEKPRTGNIYKADNWDFIGETQGIEVKRRGEDWLNKQYKKTDNKKWIFGCKFKTAWENTLTPSSLRSSGNLINVTQLRSEPPLRRGSPLRPNSQATLENFG